MLFDILIYQLNKNVFEPDNKICKDYFNKLYNIIHTFFNGKIYINKQMKTTKVHKNDNC